MDRQNSTGHGESSSGFVSRFARARSGAVAIWFAVMALPLAVLSFALIDINRASVEKRYLQDALDAAVLLVARSTATTNGQAQSLGSAALAAQLSGMSDATLVSSSFKIEGSTVKGTATSGLSPYVSNLWLGGDMSVGAVAEATRAASNLEVALVLDITGSMNGQKIIDMRAAAKDLVDIVVQSSQTPYYSKIALVPYSAAVNVGGYADAVRGTPVPPRAISGASWTTGSSKSITGVTRGATTTIAANGHGFSNGDTVWIADIKGTDELNDRAYTVASVTANSFVLSGVNSSNYDKYKSKGSVVKCRVSDCSIVITSNGHGFSNGDSILIEDVNGMDEINDQVFTAANVTANTFSLSGVDGKEYGNYTSGGQAICVMAGCQYFRFTSAVEQEEIYEIQSCVTERIGSAAYTDASPTSEPVGRHYLTFSNNGGSSRACPSATITPLSSDKVALKAQIDGYRDGGSTAGQIGLAWGWYLISPNFASLWPSASRGAAYGAPNVLKVVILMTDGDFNTAYCNGVLAQDSGPGSGGMSSKIDCDATNGSSLDQAQALCTAMKAKDIVIYTVGFQVGSGSTAETLMKKCASTNDHYYLPSNGAALKDAFASIGKDIMKLRLSK
jgi:Flp pilus assembly protein TadG